MNVLENIKPERVMHYFEEISSIARGSGNTERICDYCVEFAKNHFLSVRRDKYNNCIIEKAASGGSKCTEAIILQGHIDMVCEKTEDCTLDMDKDGLRLCTDGEYIWADKTTLGGDDGIAVAMILAILENNDLPMPPIYAVLTSDEEIGMIGAEGLDMSGINAHRLINIDSEDEGVFTVGCAGGCTAECVIPVKRESVQGNLYRVKIAGLTGGHSGTEINRGRLNACMLLGRVLEEIKGKIININGGGKDNAIASSASAEFCSNEDISKYAEDLEKIFRAEAPEEDKGVCVKIEKCGSGVYSALDELSAKRALAMLLCLPGGVQSMSCEIEGLVRTSLNLGILKTGEDKITASLCVRSMLGTEKKALLDKIFTLAELLGGAAFVKGDYPAWEYSGDSELCRIMTEVFERQYGRKPKIEAIHAGLECGLFCGKIKNLECVSIGPDILDIHTPKEKLDILSVERVWSYLLAVLEQMSGEL